MLGDLRRLLGLGGDLSFGWELIKYLLPSGVGAAFSTYLLGWGLSFFQWVNELPLILRGGFYLCVFLSVFLLISRSRAAARQPSGQPAPSPQRDSAATIAEEAATEANRTAQEAVGDSGSGPGQPENLKAICLHLAEDLMEFDRRHRHADVSVEVRIKRKNAATYEEANALREREFEMEHRHDVETVLRYHAEFKPSVMDLYDRLAPHWFRQGDKDLFENVSDWKEIEDVARRLKTVGDRLPDS